jgi:hypothetical protein
MGKHLPIMSCGEISKKKSHAAPHTHTHLTLATREPPHPHAMIAQHLHAASEKQAKEPALGLMIRLN